MLGQCFTAAAHPSSHYFSIKTAAKASRLVQLPQPGLLAFGRAALSGFISFSKGVIWLRSISSPFWLWALGAWSRSLLRVMTTHNFRPAPKGVQLLIVAWCWIACHQATGILTASCLRSCFLEQSLQLNRNPNRPTISYRARLLCLHDPCLIKLPQRKLESDKKGKHPPTWRKDSGNEWEKQ